MKNSVIKIAAFGILAVGLILSGGAKTWAVDPSDRDHAGIGHGEADGRKFVAQMPAMRWDDTLTMVYERQFNSKREDLPLPAKAWAAPLSATYQLQFVTSLPR